MPRRIVDSETGFIKFISTPEEKAIRVLEKENKAIREENEELRETINSLIERLDKAGI